MDDWWEAAGAGFGIYVHVPFCTRRCDYCAFATWTDRSHLMATYASACRAEVRAARETGSVPPATSVFFGGGTPSLLPADELVAILDTVDRADGCEVTVECNPETVTADLLATYRRGGVTRLSFGVQSMVPAVLAALGREHAAESVPRAVALARSAGFDDWNADLIYGGAGESVDDWRRTLEAVLELEPPHVSAYALTVEPGTPLALDPARHPDDDDQADKYLLAEEMLTAAGLESYEISNWSRPGRRCRHNLLYWAQGDYLGIGCAAHSHRAGRRWWNLRTPERYIEAVESGRTTEAAGESVEGPGRSLERLQLSLRTTAGVPADALAPEALDPAAGLVTVSGDRARLTVKGRLLANSVSMHLRP